MRRKINEGCAHKQARNTRKRLENLKQKRNLEAARRFRDFGLILILIGFFVKPFEPVIG